MQRSRFVKARLLWGSSDDGDPVKHRALLLRGTDNRETRSCKAVPHGICRIPILALQRYIPDFRTVNLGILLTSFTYVCKKFSSLFMSPNIPMPIMRRSKPQQVASPWVEINCYQLSWSPTNSTSFLSTLNSKDQHLEDPASERDDGDLVAFSHLPLDLR